MSLIPMMSRALLFFFFSSRRRHTRCGRDWSSDVCSSDLEDDVSLAPVVVGQWLEKTAVEERDAAFEAVAPRFLSAVGRQRVVKERFENVVEEIIVSTVVATGEPPEEIVRPSAPILSFGHAEPALLLEEVEENNLAHQLLGELHGADFLLFELVADSFVFGREFFQCLVNLAE